MMLNDVEPMTIAGRWWRNDELWIISTRGEQGEIHLWKVSRDVEVVTPKRAHTMKAIFKPEDDKRDAEVEDK